MEEKLKSFLLKFAELERRVRKLSAEDRGLREEVKRLRGQLEAAAAQSQALREMLTREQALRTRARDEVDQLLTRLSGLRGRTAAEAEARAEEAEA